MQFNNILVLVDKIDKQSKLLEAAMMLGQKHSAHLWLCHYVPSDMDYVAYEVRAETLRNDFSNELREAHQTMLALSEEVRAKGITTTAALFQGHLEQYLIKKCSHVSADLVMLDQHGSHRHGLQDAVIEVCSLLVV